MESTEKKYFSFLKNQKKNITKNKAFSNILKIQKMIKKADKIGQKKHSKELLLILRATREELKLIDMGIDTFLYESDVQKYIDDISYNTVKTIELYRYPREIPDEITETIESVNDIFDDFIILYTDYTGEETKKALDEREKERDPIIFGIFKDGDDMTEKLYYLGDWEDEYCDLTLSKIIEESPEIVKNISCSDILEETEKMLTEERKEEEVKKRKGFFFKRR